MYFCVQFRSIGLCVSAKTAQPRYCSRKCWNEVDQFLPLYSFSEFLALLVPLPLHIYLRIILSMLAEIFCWDFARTWVKPVCQFKEDDMFTICQVFQSMNTVCMVHVFRDLLWFISSALCSFQHTSPGMFCKLYA